MKNSFGFTLIEVLLALVILALVFSGFTGLVYGNLQIRKQTAEKSYRILKAADIMEYLKTVNPDNYSGEFRVEDIISWPDFNIELNKDYIEKIKIETREFSEINNTTLQFVSVEVIGRINEGTENYKLITLFYRKGR